MTASRPMPRPTGKRGYARGLAGWLGAVLFILGLNIFSPSASAQSQSLEPGTVVTLLPPDLIGAYATAVISGDHQLVFDASLEPETEVRVLIVPPGADSAPSPPYGRVSPSGDDIYINFDGATQAVSLRYWLADTYGVDLVFTPSVQGVP